MPLVTFFKHLLNLHFFCNVNSFQSPCIEGSYSWGMKEGGMSGKETVPVPVLFSWRARLRDGWDIHPIMPFTTPLKETPKPQTGLQRPGITVKFLLPVKFWQHHPLQMETWANKIGQTCLHSLAADGWWKATQAGLRQPWLPLRTPASSGKCSLRSFHCFSDGKKKTTISICPYGLTWVLLAFELLQAPEQGME